VLRLSNLNCLNTSKFPFVDLPFVDLRNLSISSLHMFLVRSLIYLQISEYDDLYIYLQLQHMCPFCFHCLCI
jgi:hypothetical protein